MKPEDLDRTVGTDLHSLPDVERTVLIAIDGKTVRGTINPDNPHGDHLLAAYLPDEGMVAREPR